MEEMKNNHTEEVVEQRPSTKYGRTAYQEQLRKEQEEAGNVNGQNPSQNPYERNPYEQNPYQQNGYQQNWNTAGQNSYTQNPYQADPNQAYTPYQEPKVEVKNTFAYVLMALVAATAIVNCIVSVMTMGVIAELQTIEVMEIVEVLTTSTQFTVLSYVTDLIFWITVVFFVLDIMALYKAGKKITGAILFEIFLRPAYFIWRAHLLGQKKTASVIYTICYYGFCIAEYIFIFLAALGIASTMV